MVVVPNPQSEFFSGPGKRQVDAVIYESLCQGEARGEIRR
jgi:hypothetical protein